jgi:cytochrome c-type biogenesis protein CcmF
MGNPVPHPVEAVRGTKITVGPPFFNKVNVPMGLLLLTLTGIGPLIAWRKASTANLKRQFTWPVVTGVVVLGIVLASGMRHLYSIMALSLGGFVAGTLVQEFARGTSARHRMYNESYPRALAHLVARNRRRYGGYLVHAGMLIYFVAFTGMAFKRDMEATLKPGDSITMMSPFGHEYQFTHVGVSQYESLNRVVTAASVEVKKDGKAVGIMSSEKRQHVDSFGRPTFEPSTEVAIRSNLQEDLNRLRRLVQEPRRRCTDSPSIPCTWCIRRHGAGGRRLDHDVAGRTHRPWCATSRAGGVRVELTSAGSQ